MNDNIEISRTVAGWYIYTILGAWLTAAVALVYSMKLNNNTVSE